MLVWISWEMRSFVSGAVPLLEFIGLQEIIGAQQQRLAAVPDDLEALVRALGEVFIDPNKEPLQGFEAAAGALFAVFPDHVAVGAVAVARLGRLKYDGGHVDPFPVPHGVY